MKRFALTPARWVGMLCCLFALNMAQAKDDGTDPSVTIEKDILRTVVAEDGSYASTQDLVLLINEERAIQAKAQQSLYYNRTLETLEVTQAYTQKPDGRKVVVSPEQIKEQQERQSSQAPMFHDSLVKVVIFPEVAVGDRLVLSFKKQRKTPLFPGQFEDLAMPQFHPTKQFTLIYDLPKNLKLNAEAKGFKASSPKAETGRKVYQWDYVQGDNARTELGAVAYSDYGKYLAVSTFADYSEFAKAYAARANSEVTPAIRELAEKLTAKIDDPRDKALALGDWVRRNIRYVAVYIGAGGVVPHAADTVLSNRYGDCKDHVALLEALLAAVNIESTPALINLGSAYALPKVPTLGVINHVVTYVPSLDLYLDSTAEAIASGYLPAPVLDKPTVLARSGKLGHTPATQPGLVHNSTTYTVASSGAADFTHASKIDGWAAEMNRWMMRNMQPAERDLLTQRILAAYGQRGSGKISSDDLETSGAFEMHINGRSENLVNLPGPIGVPTLTSLAGGIAQNVFGFIAEKQRTQDFTCISGITEEQARFEFPADVKIIAAPKPVTLKDKHFDYSAEYALQGNSLVVKRRLDFHNPKAVCSVKDFEKMKPTLDAMLNDLNSQVIVQKS
ncbi:MULTISPECIES: DUF3857 domain-containing transglutaminase family protein [Pseudomonas]|uniref:DUF3857 and transglutaminase domain-containing protein n=1 Tax=Pseudomonas donghuensis TaxID=1163398 RepID=A0AAP0X9M2_9PSED|nr:MULTISPECIES: DUF3857 and transglutaminase domain-containing protein [Pseudomonas]MDF9891087.1 transglutaminase-like putative cysteine protease [Pseudomonas vranovensis]KDN99235.2 DUF3857 and transglutaminase domain-containing protein [Pseudomonas donghuensis]MBF4206124.1 DUF3857 domain-containing protein [Pseudomonas donghuensis]MCP3749955.1 DUF3857 and transglutaminase domain-containing protein [Pseudomonas sp. SBB6]MCP6693361.1 DUF3857 and transglutaminase domain-containing protein [Pseu